jgi:AcrR family transcriptional regulator
MSATTRKSSPPGNVRERILDAAMRVISSGGAKGLAQPQIAKEAGVPQGHLTYYFPKKIDLVRGIADRMRAVIMEEVGPLLFSKGSIREKFLGVMSRTAQNRGRTRVLLALLVEMEHDDELRNELTERVHALRGVFAGVMGRKVGDPEADLALATAWGLGLQHLILEGKRSDEETRELFARLLERMEPPTSSR